MRLLRKIILDGLTYPDLAGRRQLRAHTVISLAILILLVLMSTLILFKQMQVMSAVEGTPIPIEAVESLTVLPTSTLAVEEYESGCPTEPAKWSFADPVIPQNYKLIQPACVYQGLEKTIAWALAVREGYSRAEATELLGFRELPMRQLDRVMIAATNGFTEMPVSFIPPNPNFTEWRIGANGKPAVTYALRGCFRTSTVEGNRLQVWGSDYPVVCVVVEDAENSNIVYSLEGHFFTTRALSIRSFLLFGYVGDGYWVWLGTQSDPKQEIIDPKASENERLTIATLYDSQPWDAEWLELHYQLSMQPLPANWQALNDEKELQAILSGLVLDMGVTQP
jgi:hypothetical protein